jgi:DNA-binding transcriptional MerR regulator
LSVASRHDDELTIDELAQRTGVTVRNIRAHQSRGLLPPPEVRSRTGYYGPEHVARLQLIREMQAEGFNLRAIERLLEGTHAAGEDILGFKRALMAPFETEKAEFVQLDDLFERFGGRVDEKLLRKAESLELIVPLGDDRYEVPSPTLLRAGEEVVALGVPLETALKVVEQLRRHSQAVADTFVRLFLNEVLKPFQQAGAPPEQWPRVREATEALVAAFQPTMTRAVERSFGKQLER